MSTTLAGRSVPSALLLAALSFGGSAVAQVPQRVTIPASAFAVTGKGAQSDDVAGGRRLRGPAFGKLMLRAVLPVPPATQVDSKVQGIAVHFRTSDNGPSLREVKIDGASMDRNLILKGNYLTTERTSPASVANAWTFKSTPLSVRGQVVVLLEVQFPGGFDSNVDPGEFVLGSVVVDFPRSAASFASTTLSGQAKPALIRKP